MRSAFLLASLCTVLPALAGCPVGDPGEDGPAASTTDDPSTGTTSSEPATSTTRPDTGEDTDVPPSDTELPPDTDTDTTPPDTDTDSDTDTDTDTDTGEVLGCECIVNEKGGGTNVPAAPLCGESLCANVSGACAEDFCDSKFNPQGFVLDDPDALVCALEALRDRTPGVVTWDLSELGGQYEDVGYVLMLDDGTAVRRAWGWQDLEFTVSDAGLGELAPPEYYDACLADPDALARFDCLRNAVNPTTVCDEGWTYSKF
jgi:hypothetical protein